MLREREEQAPKPTVDEEAKAKLDGQMRQIFKLPAGGVDGPNNL